MRLIFTFLISLCCFLALQALQFDNIFIFGFCVVIILTGTTYPLLRVLLWETNIEKIEKFLVKNKRNLNYYIIYAMANNLDEDVKSATEKLLQKNNQRSRQALYKIGEALHFKNFSVVKDELQYIKSTNYRLYYQAIIHIEEGEFDLAQPVINKIPTQWMKFALLAEKKKKQNHMEEAKNYAKQAKEYSKGIQRYVLYKTFEREFGI